MAAPVDSPYSIGVAGEDGWSEVVWKEDSAYYRYLLSDECAEFRKLAMDGIIAGHKDIGLSPALLPHVDNTRLHGFMGHLYTACCSSTMKLTNAEATTKRICLFFALRLRGYSAFQRLVVNDFGGTVEYLARRIDLKPAPLAGTAQPSARSVVVIGMTAVESTVSADTGTKVPDETLSSDPSCPPPLRASVISINGAAEASAVVAKASSVVAKASAGVPKVSAGVAGAGAIAEMPDAAECSSDEIPPSVRDWLHSRREAQDADFASLGWARIPTSDYFHCIPELISAKNVFLAFRWTGDHSVRYFPAVPEGTFVDLIVKRVSTTAKAKREVKLSLLLSQLFPTQDSPFVHTYTSIDAGMYTYIVQERGFMDLESRLNPDTAGMLVGERRYVSGQLVRAVTQLHSLGRFAHMESSDHLRTTTVLHRDIRPSNCLYVDRNGHTAVVLGDFGLSKTVAAAIPTVMTSLERCSLHPPDEHDSPAKDVFLLGQTLFFVFTGKWPFVQTGARDAMKAHAANVALGAVQLSHVDWGCCDVSTANLLLWMLDRDPRKRPSIDIVAQHPCFWDEEALDNFLVRAHTACAEDKIPSEVTSAFLDTLQCLESGAFPPHDVCYGTLSPDGVVVRKIGGLPIADIRPNVPAALHRMGKQTTYPTRTTSKAPQLCNFLRFLRNYTTHCGDMLAADVSPDVYKQCHSPVLFAEGGVETPAGLLCIPTASYVLRHPTLCWVVGELYRAHVERVIEYRKVYSVRFDGRTCEHTRALGELFGLRTRHLSDQYRQHLSRNEKYDVDYEMVRSDIAAFVKCVQGLGYSVFPHGMSAVTRTLSFMVNACMFLTLTEVDGIDVLENITTGTGAFVPASIRLTALDGACTNVLITILTRDEGIKTLMCSGENPEGASVNTVTSNGMLVQVPEHLRDDMGEFVLALPGKQLTTLLAEMNRKLTLLGVRNAD